MTPPNHALQRLILQSAAEGNSKGAEELPPLVYAELRQLAAAKVTQERNPKTSHSNLLINKCFSVTLLPGSR